MIPYPEELKSQAERCKANTQEQGLKANRKGYNCTSLVVSMYNRER